MEQKRALRSVQKYALLSRLIVLGMCQLSPRIVGSYDTSAALHSLHNVEDRSGSGSGNGDGLIGNWKPEFLEPLARNWDAEYFSSIAKDGYSYEQFHAFWPLLPMLTQAIEAFLSQICEITEYLGLRALHFEGFAKLEVVVPVLLANAFFVLSATELYRLSYEIWSYHHGVPGGKLARRAALVYCFTPASVFMSAFYTESLFAFLSFKGLRACYGKSGPRQTNRTFAGLRLPSFSPCYSFATGWFALSTLTRSNGILLAFNFGYVEAVGLLRDMLDERGIQEGQIATLVWKSLKRTTRLVICFLLSAVLPYAGFQYYGYYTFCRDSSIPSPEWCEYKLPMLYAYVQEHYWNQGLWRYWQMKQIPNFALAVPMTFVNIDCFHMYAFGKTASLKRSLAILPFLLHFSAMTVLCLFCMHVQVLTRFVSSCPMVYWYVACCFDEKGRNKWQKLKVYIILTYFMAYTLLGSAMFCCYYPWS